MAFGAVSRTWDLFEGPKSSSRTISRSLAFLLEGTADGTQGIRLPQPGNRFLLFTFNCMLGTGCSGASLCLVSPPLSGQLRNELSGLASGAAFDSQGSRQGSAGGGLREVRPLWFPRLGQQEESCCC